MILIIDNYDSFTYNIVQRLGELGAEIVVHRNDKITIQEIEKLKPTHIVISPGPCTPDESGISMDVVREFAGSVPILGVCLGHQAIAQAFGAKIIRCTPCHGKTSSIQHDAKGIFKDIKNPFTATRYHSLIIDQNTLPECFEVTAKNEEGLIMGIRHKIYTTLEGTQVHPESILTTEGMKILNNFWEMK